MEQLTVKDLTDALVRAFGHRSFVRKLAMSQSDAAALIHPLEWEEPLGAFLPLTRRFSCDEILSLSLSLLNAIAPPPKAGWMSYTYRVAISLLYDEADLEHTRAQRDAALCYLNILQVFFEAERAVLPFDPQFDFAFCSEEELRDSSTAGEYRQFLVRFRDEYVYELMRLGRETTPFRTLEHIAGVHHVAMSVARPFYANGGCVDLAQLSGAAAGHDIGKFGCRPGERVPYLHYHYTDLWFTQRGLENIGRIAANHSVWDLELENLSSESLALVYADFRVKQSRDESGAEIARIYSLQEAFDVILSKLDNVNIVKQTRYRHVYAKLQDFETYLKSFGVDVTLAGHSTPPPPRTDTALLRPEQVVDALRLTAADHNIRLMHQLGHEQLFGNILESARSESNPSRLRAYLSIFEEYFTYWSASQKEQTLEFLYELLLSPDGDIRRQAAALIGQVLAGFNSGYKKELPTGAEPDPADRRPFELWQEYLARLIYPDRRLTPQQISKIRYAAKLAVDALLAHAGPAEAAVFAAELFRHYADPQAVEPLAAFALLDTVVNFPLSRCADHDLTLLTNFGIYWLHAGGEPQKAAAMRLFRHLLEAIPAGTALRRAVMDAVEAADCGSSTPLLFLQTQLGRRFGWDMREQDAFLSGQNTIGNVFLDNLKSATPWVLKAAGVEYLLEQVELGNRQNVLHIATHYSNLIKVSENMVVRRMAGASLLSLASLLTPVRRNEIAVELSKSLENGDTDISRYIPEYLGRFSLWLTPQELDEVICQMETLLSSPNAGVVSAALSTVGSMLEYYSVYGDRFGEDSAVVLARRDRLAGLLLKGLSSCRESVRQETLRILGEGLFASDALEYADKEALFILMSKKILFLLGESEEKELTFFYAAAALSHIYRFLLSHLLDDGPFHFPTPSRVAFFPGTFDPFSLSHKGIVQAIRNLCFEVYLAIDEFSWSKKAQPGLLRRQMASMSVADEFHVYLFPHDVPVNIASPTDLDRLRSLFPDRELYLTVGSDVISGASSYHQAPVPGSVHSMNHIVFLRVSDQHGEDGAAAPDFSAITGDVVTLQLPPELEDISSTRIRENIDLNRDISHLIDPVVQEFIYQRGLYLREPQYKPLMEAGTLHFMREEHPSRELLREAFADQPDKRAAAAVLERGDSVLLLRARNEGSRVLGLAAWRYVRLPELYHLLQNVEQVNRVRDAASGKILCLTGLYAPTEEVMQLLLTELFTQAMADDCVYALYIRHDTQALVTDTLRCQGFCPVDAAGGDESLMLVDMNSPVVFLQNVETAVKAPFSNDPTVLATIRACRRKLKMALVGMYPGKLILTVSAQMIHHRLVEKITELNHVPMAPTYPRTLGPYMCVPFGKLLRGNAVPNTVTKTIHTDKVFAPDLLSQWIEAFPYYAPLADQMRTVKSFDRPVILVDDQLHTGRRIRVLDPLARAQGVEIREVLVGILSGQGRDLMEQWGRTVDCVYFVPNLRAWYVESTMYPFIGGDTVRREERPQQGLQPSVNMILPYTYPEHLKRCGAAAAYGLSRACLENTFHIMTVLEAAYRRTYARNLTLGRLGEVIVLPLCPDKGNLLYDPGQAVSAYLQNDLASLERMRNLFEG